MTTQPEALRLANQLRDILPAFRTPSHERGVLNGAIQRLEQLHAECEALRAALAEQAAEQAEPVAWSPRLTYPGYEAQRVWANGKPRQEDIDYWQKQGLGIDLAFAAPPAPARQEWQPIETAPRDGTNMLLWWEGRVVLGYWNKYTKPSPYPRSNWCSVGSFEGGGDIWTRPTHWQPLPAAPIPAAPAEGEKR